jgi:hypothetical protein
VQGAIVAEVVKEVKLMVSARDRPMDHPNLLKYMGIFEEPVEAGGAPTPWIVTECADSSLEDLLTRVEQGEQQPLSLSQFFTCVPLTQRWTLV